MTWHVDADLIDRYRVGSLNRSAAASVELHVSDCDECRRMVTPEDSWLDRSWMVVSDRVLAPRQGVIERALVFLRVPSHLARLVAVTPGLRPSWLAALTFVLLFAAYAPHLVAGRSVVDLFLVLAPLIPLAGVALAYGQMVDPAHEITVAAPVDGFGLLLIRSSAVTAASTLSALVVDVVMPSPQYTAIWLFPALALTLATLAVGTRLPMWMAAAAVAGAWLLFLIVLSGRSQPGAAFEPVAHLYYLTVMALAGLVLSRRRDMYRRGATR